MKSSWMKQTFLALLPLFGAAIVANGALPTAAAADVSFEGERIVWIVPGREGGGSDNFTRAIAPHLSRHLPGEPTIVIRNIPGAGTVPGTNQFHEQAKDDGLMIITNSTSAIVNQILKNDAVRYDLSDQNIVFAVPQGAFVYAHPSTKVKGPDDIGMLIGEDKTFKIGGYGPTSSELRLLVSYELLGINTKALWGMSRGKTRQALLRGEVDIAYDTASSWYRKVKPLVKNNEVVPLFSFGVRDKKGDFVRDPVAPELPHFNELYAKVKGKPLAGTELDIWTALFYVGVMSSKSIGLSPDTKPEIVAAYVAALEAMIADPKFQKAKEEKLGPYDVSIGGDADEVMNKAVNMSPDARAWLKDFLKKEHDVDLKS
jgi:tripartite-type tricarboxylate transporter receptor subunit TctC